MAKFIIFIDEWQIRGHTIIDWCESHLEEGTWATGTEQAYFPKARGIATYGVVNIKNRHDALMFQIVFFQAITSLEKLENTIFEFNKETIYR